MPIYEYVCARCNGVTEKIQKMDDPPLKKCPACGGRLEKKVSAGAFVLKGTGWYATDYAGKGNGGGNGKAKSSAKKPASCPAAKSGADAPACAGCPKAE